MRGQRSSLGPAGPSDMGLNTKPSKVLKRALNEGLKFGPLNQYIPDEIHSFRVCLFYMQLSVQSLK